MGLLGRIEDQQLGSRRDRFLDPIGMEAEIGIAVDDDRLSAGHRQQVLVHHEVGIEEDRFVAGIDGGEDRQQQSAADAAGDEHIADVAADLRRQIFAQPLAQRGDALRLRVAVVAGLDRLDGGVLGDIGHIKIRQADREVDRVLHLRRKVEDLADAGGIDAVGTVGDVVVGRTHRRDNSSRARRRPGLDGQIKFRTPGQWPMGITFCPWRPAHGFSGRCSTSQQPGSQPSSSRDWRAAT